MEYWASWVVDFLELPVTISFQFLTRSEGCGKLNYPLSHNLLHRSHHRLQRYITGKFEGLVEAVMDFAGLAQVTGNFEGQVLIIAAITKATDDRLG